MQRIPATVAYLHIALWLPLVAAAGPEQSGRPDCKSLISHSGFAESVVSKEGGAYKLAIKVNPSVKWTIRNSAYVDWITILDGSSGTGPGTLTIQLDANPGKFCRVGELSIAGLMPIYGLPIKILQQGTETVAVEGKEKLYPWLVDLEPFTPNNPQNTEVRKTFKKR